MKFIKLSKETKVTYGRTLTRVELTIDCKWGKKGDLGGFVESLDSLRYENIDDGFLFKGEIFADAVIRGGVIRGGVIRGGEILADAVIRGGVIWGGVIRGGVIRGGVIRGGEIRGGVIRGGEIRGGVIWGGVIRGGEIWRGEIWGGEIWGGVIRGGVIRGGVIRGGEIWGGVIRGGVFMKTALQIVGTKHFLSFCTKGILRIGCQEKKLSEWSKNFKSIGKEFGYSAGEIKEYGLYIKLFVEWEKINKDTIKNEEKK